MARTRGSKWDGGLDDLRPTMVRLPEALRRRLEQRAAFYSRSLNNEIIYRLARSLADDEARREQANEDARTLSKESMSVRLDRIERTLESYERLLRAQQKVAHDALAALARAPAKTLEPESGPPIGSLTWLTPKDEDK